ncbi:hypothetical protein AAFF_G00145000 [Aldrovandia affinis]|uniref:PDZ domain-containing protein n=1 Tax=Aldrovandia affinis TaxID=143900 RepID=A0AAD7T1E0_9TELE|nr:hypothetical protein AAFF_G00145000 [Aldrovandia affinis]
MKNMSFWRLEKWSSNRPEHRTPCPGSAAMHLPSSKSDNSKNMVSTNSSLDVYNYKTLAYSGGTLPRNHRTTWNSVTRSPEQHRKVVVLEKEDEEAFGFEIQTYGLHHADETSVEMCTFVCKVHTDSPAHRAGLRVGDTISGVNEASVDGFRHQEIVQLIRSCGNTIRLETVYSDSIRKAELEARLQYLRQTLWEKRDEYECLMKQEQKLLCGILTNEEGVCKSKALACPSPVPGPAHFPSSSTDRVGLTAENGPPNRAYQGDSAVEQPPGGNRTASSLLATAKTHLTRSASTRSYRGAAGPSVFSGKQGSGSQVHYGSLPRKTKQNSFRRHLVRLIPGLSQPLEEDENKL